MTQDVLLRITSIVVLGIAAQWAAWALRIPSILLLLAAGILAGPLVGFLDPDELFGPLLLPLVSLSVAVILYEGGLSLKIRDLRGVSGVFVRLTTIGVLVSWLGAAVAAHWFLESPWPLAALHGAILVVTGPTVIGPILRHLRLGGQAGALLRWEGIVIDPIGATLAVMVFAAVRAGPGPQGTTHALMDLGETLLVGGALGTLGAIALAQALRRFWIPDSLQNAVSLVTVFATHTASNVLQQEAGLLAVTVMGIILANQKWAPIKHLIEFKENLSVLLISCLFIILASRLKLEDFAGLTLGRFLFVGALVLLVRPASVLVSTAFSSLSWRERLFLCWMAPRGIVAVAVSSVFALEMVVVGYPRAAEMVPITFLVVFVTVLLYGLSAAPLARRLGLARPNPQGLLFVGGHDWARAMAQALKAEGVPVVVVDTDWENICLAEMAGLPCHHGSILAESTLDEIDFSELGRLLAVTGNNEVNCLACLRYAEEFGRREVYQLPFAAPVEDHGEPVSLEQRGRFLFGPDMTHAHLTELFGIHPHITRIPIDDDLDLDEFEAQHGAIVPLFLVKPTGEVVVYTARPSPEPELESGQVLLGLISHSDQAPRSDPDQDQEQEPAPRGSTPHFPSASEASAAETHP